MKNLVKIILSVFVILFLISGVFTILGALFSFTFGIIGTILSLVWKLVTNPAVLILIIVCIVYKFRKVAN